jgi:hypothetical protein
MMAKVRRRSISSLIPMNEASLMVDGYDSGSHDNEFRCKNQGERGSFFSYIVSRGWYTQVRRSDECNIHDAK